MGGKMSDVVILEKELSYTIMQAAFEVHNTLGPGFPEKIYEEALNAKDANEAKNAKGIGIDAR
jgi:hypothetical protein